MKVRYLHLLTLFAALAMLAATLVPSGGVASAQGGTVTVTSDQLNVRSAPSTSASIMTVLNQGDVVPIFGTVAGEEVSAGNSTWYKTKSGWYIYSGSTSATAGQGASASGGLSGRWIDANLSSATVTAMEGNTPVYTAYSTIGTANNPTPTGSFAIVRRVANETMDSSTIGIPNNAPGGYYLTGVLYTQYFTNEGHALHYNYWSPASAFGSQAGSHGCLGLTLGASRYFWDFAGVGTPVIIHY
jgi:lipoprotein-anchoring transpeptidase ErfK/SrfK